MGDTSSIGDRMKAYERVSAPKLTKRVPVIIRIDGKAFHTFTRRYGKGYSETFQETMCFIAEQTANHIQGCSFAYGQSDEISFLLTDYTTVKTQGWFDYEVNKLVSVSAAIASSYMTAVVGEPVQFDSRAFSVPQDDVCNYFLWRQRDATRNAIQMAGREHYSHKELYQKDNGEIQELLWQKGVNFNDFPVIRRRGYCVVDGDLELEPPIFSQEREYIERHVFVRED